MGLILIVDLEMPGVEIVNSANLVSAKTLVKKLKQDL